MAKFIGRQLSVGIAKEATRGTGVAAQFWIPKTDVTVDDIIMSAQDDSSIAVIEDAINQEVTTKAMQGSLAGRVYDKSFGLLLLAVLGSQATTTTSGESAVYDHAFTVGESAQHPSLTISVADANTPSSGAGIWHTLCMIDQLTIDFEVNKFFTYKADFKGNSNVAQSVTASFTSENGFDPQDGTVTTAANISGLASPVTVKVKKGSIIIKKNIEEDYVIGSQTAADRLNKQFTVEGTLELFYNDRVFIDTDMLADLAQAIRISFTNTRVTLGSTSNPVIQITLAKAKIQSVAKKAANNNIVSETIKFKAFYSLADIEMIDVLLRNTKSGTY